MKKILLVNTKFTKGGASGVARSLFFGLAGNNVHMYFAYGRGEKSLEKNTFKFGNSFETIIHIFLVRFLGLEGYGSYFSTRKLIKYIQKEKFDAIHLHNVHGYYLNFYTLFRFLNEYKLPIVWTLHDEWILTSLYAHEGVSSYPATYNPLFLKILLYRKRKAIVGLKNLTIISPAEWLAKKVRNSYLKDINVQVVQNAVNLDLFKPVNNKNFLRQKYKLPENKKIILFPAGKGNQYMLKVEDILKDADNFFLGFSGVTDRSKIADLFALSDLFCMPSEAETAPLVVLEAFASGLPVVGFDIVALCELVTSEVGALVPFGDVQLLSEAIIQNLKEQIQSEKSKNARNKALTSFSQDNFLKKYLELYTEILQ